MLLSYLMKNNAEKIFTDQLDDQYADQWTKSGGIGMSQLIYDQLMEKYGVRFGLKAAVDKPLGPIATNQKMNFSGISLGSRKPCFSFWPVLYTAPELAMIIFGALIFSVAVACNKFWVPRTEVSKIIFACCESRTVLFSPAR